MQSGVMRERVGRWEKRLEDCLQFDQWGQIVEAQEEYRQWIEDVSELLRDGGSAAEIPAPQRRQVRRLQATLQRRVDNIRHHAGTGLGGTQPPAGEGPGIDYQTIRKIHDDFRAYFFDGKEWPIPIDAHAIESDDDDDDGGDEDAFHDNRGNLLGAPRERGRFLKLTIESIGLKDSEDYLDPFIAVSVRRGREMLGREQETPKPRAPRERTKVPFGDRGQGVSLFIQTPLDDVVERQANIFFEFKHYKPKGGKKGEGKISTRCWSMLGWDELKALEDGKQELEIYAKPTDYSARKFHKHSVKPLYLTVIVSVVENHT